MQFTKDVRVLRGLAARYAEICAGPEQVERRNLWRDHNSFVRTRPPIYVRGWPPEEVPEVRALECEDAFYRGHEHWLRDMIYQAKIGDDFTFEPYITQQATRVLPPEGVWGLAVNHIPSPVAGGAWKYDPPIKSLEDAAKMVRPRHEIDEERTARDVSRLQDAVGDIIEVNICRAPEWRVWNADISTRLGHLRGLEQLMWDMMDNPEWLHGVLAFMRDGILAAQDQAEAAGDWSLADHENQAMPYARELADPRANSFGAKRKELWVFCASQELTLVSPEMHDEFMLAYQLPIIAKFGLSAYGCCEDLTDKIDMLRKIPNLRRIAVTPRANVRRSAEQIGTDYVLSYRPNPAEMVCCGFDPGHVRKVIRQAMEDSKGCFVDITLKDIQTVENQPERLAEWVRVVREISDEY